MLATVYGDWRQGACAIVLCSMICGVMFMDYSQSVAVVTLSFMGFIVSSGLIVSLTDSLISLRKREMLEARTKRGHGRCGTS